VLRVGSDRPQHNQAEHPNVPWGGASGFVVFSAAKHIVGRRQPVSSIKRSTSGDPDQSVNTPPTPQGTSAQGDRGEGAGEHRSLRASVNQFPPGLKQMDPLPYALVCMHLGPSVEVLCMRGGTVRRGREVAGDLDIIPANTPSAWELKQPAAALIMRVPDALLKTVASELEMDPRCIEIADRFQLRDPVIEHIGWAIKADLESGTSCGRLFRQSLGTALATRLLQRHNNYSLPMRDVQGGLSAWRLKQVISYIEDNLESDLSLAEIAVVAGISVSHLKTLFRQSTGTPVHQYVLRRRVERAKLLLQDRTLSIAQVAFAAGFAHQSHLARHMRRILGMTPAAARRDLRTV
jgi:AraC family transcriptional regulator